MVVRSLVLARGHQGVRQAEAILATLGVAGDRLLQERDGVLGRPARIRAIARRPASSPSIDAPLLRSWSIHCRRWESLGEGFSAPR